MLSALAGSKLHMYTIEHWSFYNFNLCHHFTDMESSHSIIMTLSLGTKEKKILLKLI